MPDRGLMDAGPAAAGLIDGSAPRELVLTDARIVQLTFEVAQDAALACMPGEVSRPVPCYARLFAVDSDAARFALLMVGGRHRMLPRNVLVQGVVDGDAAATSAALGGPLVEGTVQLVRQGDTLDLQVADAAGPLASATLPRLRVVDPSMLRWDPWLTFARQGRSLGLLEIAPLTSVRSAYLSKGQALTMQSGRADAVWSALRSVNPVSACYAEGTLTLSEAQLQVEPG